MQDLSNVQVLVGLLLSMITLLTSLGAFLNKMLDKKLVGLYHDNRRQYRYLIVDFAGDLHNGITKTRDEFKAILDIFGRYETLVEKLKVENHYVDTEMKYIKKRYEELK